VMAYWHLNSARALEALKSGKNAISEAPLALAEINGNPEPHDVPSDLRVIRVALPADIAQLRTSNMELARLWRQQVRDALEPRLAVQWKITGFTHDRSYVLEAADAHS